MKNYSFVSICVLLLSLIVLPANPTQALASFQGEAPVIVPVAQPAGTMTYLPIVNGTTRDYVLTIWHGLNEGADSGLSTSDG